MDPERTARYPFVSEAGRPPPVAIERTEGPWLIAADGRRIYDAAGGAIVSNIGHGRREVAEAAAAAMEEVTYVVPPFASPSRVRLVERLQDHWLPGDISRVVFTSGGSESMDAAIRLARQHHLSAGRPDRWKIISRELSYHGTTIGTLAIGGNTKRRAPFEPLLFDSPKAPNCYPLRCALCRGEGGCTLACADAIEDVILQAGPETVAAFVGEPIVGSTAGAIVPPDDYWSRVAEVCRKYGILLIADEVMVGFGRTGRRFALDHWDVVPDVLVAGKGLGGGYMPIGGVYTREEVIAPIAAAGNELMFFTYSAHPAACAAADKVLEIIDREGLVERAADMGERLRERLAPLQDHPNVAEVRGRGLFQAVEFVRDRESLEPFPADVRFAGRFVATALGNGVFFYPGGCDPARDVVCFGPPFTITMDEIDHIVGVFEKTLAEVLASLEAA